jgi:hypothetical protein
MLHMFDRALETVGWTLGPVYWDWSRESQDILKSDVWKYLGGLGTGPNWCVKDGLFAAGQVSTINIKQG